MKTIKLLIFGLFLLVAQFATSQTFKPVNYTFIKDPSASQHGTAGGSQFENSFNFNWSAANGYGVWGVNKQNEWYLMSNRLGDSFLGDSNGTTNGPVGYVAKGSFDFSFNPDTAGTCYPKVATNLKGSVRFVRLSGSRDSLFIRGFDDEQLRIQPDIDIEFNGIPKPASTLNPIKAPLRVFPSIYLGLGQPSLTLQHEDDTRDWFDIAMDAKFLYITWTRHDPVNLTNRYSVWTTVITLDSGIQLTGFPKNVSDTGRRPTIACDVRNNSIGTASPEFDIAYIKTVDIHNIGIVMHYYQDGAIIQGPYPIGNTVRYINSPVVDFYTKPQHCRMLVSSTTIPIPVAPVKAIYVLADHDTTFFNTCGILVYHKILNNTNMGFVIKGQYVDGNRTNLHPQPITSPRFHELYDGPLIGFANPYDGESSSDYNEFHCLYSLKEVHGDTSYRPILIVRGVDNGRFNNPNTITPLTRYSPNNGLSWFRTALPLDNDYSGCVNQMGIFAYWREYPKSNKESVLMARDTSRAFDEPIEENTLVSHSCWIKDGRGHFGTIGAELLKNRTLTLWSDPFHRLGFGFEGTQHYLPGDYTKGDFFNANLIFKDSLHTSPVHLRIGSDTSTFGGGALMVAMPNHLITFEDSLIDRGQKLIINPYHKLSWYGGPFIEVPNNYRRSTIHGAGTIQLKPNSNLVVHGGSQLIIPDYARLEANNAVITLKHEPSIIPPYMTLDPTKQDQTTGLNINGHGQILVHGSMQLDTATVQASVDHYQRQSLIRILPSLYSYTTPALNVNQFVATHTFFHGGYLVTSGGTDFGFYNLGIFADADLNKPVRKVLITNCDMLGTVVIGERITNDFTIANNNFSRFGGRSAILITRPFTATGVYNDISISNNFIEIDKLHGITSDTMSSAIIIENYDSLRTGIYDRITISNNEIYTLSGGGGHDSCYGIGLFNTSAIVTGNIINMGDLWYGIANMFTASDNSFTNSFICSNTITNCIVDGLLTENWRGHAKLNNISGSGIGHHSNDKDVGGITYSRYFNNNGAGLRLFSSTTSIDLSGKNAGGQQTPSFDTIDHNNTSQDTTTGEMHIANSTLVLGTSSIDSATVADFAKNSFIKDTSNKYIIYNDGTSNIAVGGINQNFWGEGSLLSPTAIALPPAQSQNLLRRVTYLPSTVSPLCGLSPFGDSEGEECGVTYTFGIKSKRQFAQSLDTVSCEELKYLGKVFGDNEMYRQEYDTMKYAMEMCALYPDYWRQFNRIVSACNFMPGPAQRLDTCREWLKKVLYYNMIDSNYYCADVDAIMSTFGYFPGRGQDFLGALAVAKYIKETGRCKTFGFIQNYLRDSIQTMKDIEYAWRDSVQDSIKTPFNPVIPTIDELNLGILRGPNEVVGRTHDYRLGELIAVRNPFNDVLDLKYRLIMNGLVKVDVLDILGRSIYSEGQGYKPEGEHSLSLHTSNWASGSYYVRLSTPSGEIKTVKVIKE